MRVIPVIAMLMGLIFTQRAGATDFFWTNSDYGTLVWSEISNGQALGYGGCPGPYLEGQLVYEPDIDGGPGENYSTCAANGSSVGGSYSVVDVGGDALLDFTTADLVEYTGIFDAVHTWSASDEGDEAWFWIQGYASLYGTHTLSTDPAPGVQNASVWTYFNYTWTSSGNAQLHRHGVDGVINIAGGVTFGSDWDSGIMSAEYTDPSTSEAVFIFEEMNAGSGSLIVDFTSNVAEGSVVVSELYPFYTHDWGLYLDHCIEGSHPPVTQWFDSYMTLKINVVQ